MDLLEALDCEHEALSPFALTEPFKNALKFIKWNHNTCVSNVFLNFHVCSGLSGTLKIHYKPVFEPGITTVNV